MLRGPIRIVIAFLAVISGFSQITQEVSVVNISVPVRVYDGNRFVDSLRLEDFEVSEDGKPQTVLAAYLVRGGDISRREGPLKTIAPETRRHFVLLFQMTEYLPELDAAISYFFDNILRPGDSVDLVTPRKTYRLTRSLTTVDGVRKARQAVISRVRQDILVDSGFYTSIIADLTRNLEDAYDAATLEVKQRRVPAGELDALLNAYAENLQRLEAIQMIDPSTMASLAKELRARPGPKHVFLFFQKEQIPQISNKSLAAFLDSIDPEQTLKIEELMAKVRHVTPIDREEIGRAFADASIDVHFLYVTRRRRQFAQDVERQTALEKVTMGERTGDIYDAFRDIASATGGTIGSSSNPSELLKEANGAAEQYYLLYYRPSDFKPDGTFHAIKVKVRSEGFRVSYRMGYVADAQMTAGSAEGSARTLTGQAAQEPAALTPEVETMTSASAVSRAPADSLLRSTAAYCRRLQDAVLNFACREEVREQLSEALQPHAPILQDTAPEEHGRMALRSGEVYHEWIYDYLLTRDRGKFQESRILLEEDGKAKRKEGAELATSRFGHSYIILGPVGLLGGDAQKTFSYLVVKELDLEGEPGLILDVRPKDPGAAGLYGKAWVRIRDGAVLRIEWEPASMDNYKQVEELAKAIHARPQITFASEYAFEKNGLRFPSAYSVIESYLRGAGGKLRLSKTDVLYKDYKFFQVKTEVMF